MLGAVGGLKIPPVDRFIAGYYAGAKKASPKVKVVHAYSQDFVDQAKCKEQALNQIANGAGVVFQVAGQCGLGVLSAAKEKKVFGIGVDADQGYLGAHVLTSATKKVDVAVSKTIAAAQGRRVPVPHGLQRHLHREERRRRLRQDLYPDLAGAQDRGREHPEADRLRQDQGHRAVPARDHGLRHALRRKGRGFDPAPSGITPPMVRRLTLLAAPRRWRSPGCGSDDESAGTTRPGAGGDDDRGGRPRAPASGSSRTSAGSTTAPSTSSRTRGSSAPRRSSASQGRVLISKADADYVPNLTSLAKQDYDLVIAVGFLMAEALEQRRRALPGRRLRDHRLLAGGDGVEAGERARAALQGAGGRLPRRLPRRAADEAGGGLAAGDRLGRRPEDPAGRPLHRRLPGGREGREPGDRDPERLLAGLRRPGEVQGGRARPDRPRRPGHLPGRRPVRPRRARRPRRSRTCAASASTPTRPTSATTS